ncbi:MAG TPA: methionine--tRNA ligase [Cytophagales bacterium]|nr:methionine--tRNA ligase [Cytophagales bacterium]HAP63451.1 methionine--tRNA ligase [Cytophagales bacterium]
MDSNQERYTVTAALPYANGPIHLGHLAGVYISADIFVRYLRLKGKDVLFVCGSDEHGIAITMRARKDGTTPQAIVDKYHEQIAGSFEKFGISFDVYSRTSSPTHHETASEFFTNLYEKNILEEQVSEQFYDATAKEFLADRYIKGTCPRCGFEEAYGDQCENCGSTLSPQELINPTSMLSGEAPVMKQTKHWYLPMGQYEDWLREWIVEGHKEDWKPNVVGQVKSWLDQGLRPRAMTRDLEWGVAVPLPEAEGKVLYVWFDAPIGYISATKDWAAVANKDWEPYWKDENTKLVHFIGKDNIVFHAIIFPIMLKAHGDFVLPDNVPANEFLNLEGRKLSTSRNWAVWLHEYLEELPDKEDVLRYVLTANSPETKDNDFSWKDYQTRNNSELVAILGNLVNRAVVLTHKYFDGKVPAANDLQPIDKQTLATMAEFPGRIEQSLDRYKFRDALSQLMDLARLGNKYLADTEPWKLIKQQPDRVEAVLNTALQITANLAILAEPFLPQTAQKIREMLHLDLTGWAQAGKPDLLEAGQPIEKATLLFEKIEDSLVEAQLNKLMENTPQEETQEEVVVAPAKDEITFDDFVKMDMRVGTITAAEKIKKSKKLLKLTIDTGLDVRTVLSGIALHFTAEEVVGQQVVLLANLAPRPMMGEVSQGMVLMAEDAEGNLRFVRPTEPVNNGAQIS